MRTDDQRYKGHVKFINRSGGRVAIRSACGATQLCQYHWNDPILKELSSLTPVSFKVCDGYIQDLKVDSTRTPQDICSDILIGILERNEEHFDLYIHNYIRIAERL